MFFPTRNFVLVVYSVWQCNRRSKFAILSNFSQRRRAAFVVLFAKRNCYTNNKSRRHCRRKRPRTKQVEKVGQNCLYTYSISSTMRRRWRNIISTRDDTPGTGSPEGLKIKNDERERERKVLILNFFFFAFFNFVVRHFYPSRKQ